MISVMQLNDEIAVMYNKLESLPDLPRHSNLDGDVNLLFLHLHLLVLLISKSMLERRLAPVCVL